MRNKKVLAKKPDVQYTCGGSSKGLKVNGLHFREKASDSVCGDVLEGDVNILLKSLKVQY